MSERYARPVPQVGDRTSAAERRADPDDARCVRAYLTAKGKRLADDIERESEERLVRTFSKLGERDAAELIRIIRRLSEEGE